MDGRAGLRDHLPADRLDLVPEGADAGQADRELPVVGRDEASAGGLHDQCSRLASAGRRTSFSAAVSAPRIAASSGEITASSIVPSASRTRHLNPAEPFAPSGRKSRTTSTSKCAQTVTRLPI